MRQGLSANERVSIKSFPGARNECMSDYIKPSLKYTCRRRAVVEGVEQFSTIELVNI